MNAIFSLSFPGSARYWELRYRLGGTSGAGSYGPDQAYKTDYLNRFFAEHDVKSVIDFGFGDGNQLRELRIDRYLGFDVSAAAVHRCRERYAADTSKEFRIVDEYRGERAEASLSLDVLYHLVEDEVFDGYVDRLFGAADRYVVVYATNLDDARVLRGRHVRDRRFTDIVAARFKEFALIDSPPRPEHLGEGASFFAFKRA